MLLQWSNLSTCNVQKEETNDAHQFVLKPSVQTQTMKKSRIILSNISVHAQS